MRLDGTLLACLSETNDSFPDGGSDESENALFSSHASLEPVQVILHNAVAEPRL